MKTSIYLGDVKPNTLNYFIKLLGDNKFVLLSLDENELVCYDQEFNYMRYCLSTDEVGYFLEQEIHSPISILKKDKTKDGDWKASSFSYIRKYYGNINDIVLNMIHVQQDEQLLQTEDYIFKILNIDLSEE